MSTQLIILYDGTLPANNIKVQFSFPLQKLTILIARIRFIHFDILFECSRSVIAKNFMRNRAIFRKNLLNKLTLLCRFARRRKGVRERRRNVERNNSRSSPLTRCRESEWSLRSIRTQPPARFSCALPFFHQHREPENERVKKRIKLSAADEEKNDPNASVKLILSFSFAGAYGSRLARDTHVIRRKCRLTFYDLVIFPTNILLHPTMT